MLAMVVLGGLGGVAWQAWWPGVEGLAYQHEWILDPTRSGEDFAGTGGYLLGAAALGLLSGLAVARWVRPPLVALGVGLLGGLLAGWVMAVVGHLLGPVDPTALAASSPDLTRIPGELRVHGVSAYLAFPAGSLVALLVVFLTTAEPADSPNIGSA
ncbi:MAG: hypothetical protein WAW88_10130 [Nocardioides sp.]